MSKHNTAIEWTHLPGFKGETWNPIVGCSVTSPGCTNCYAMRVAERLKQIGLQQYQGLTVSSKAGPVWNGRLNIAPESVLEKPLRWKKPRAVFVNSMGDLFHEDAPVDWIARVFAIMAKCPDHIFMVLTKRSDRMLKLLQRGYYGTGTISLLHGVTAQKLGTAPPFVNWPLPNVWLGVSVEDQARADQRIPELLSTPAAKRFLSCEPLLGPVDLSSIERRKAQGFMRPLDGRFRTIDWVIAGGESGPRARPMHLDWVRSIRDHCGEAHVPFFFKQWGEWLPWSQYEWSQVPIEDDCAGSSYTTMIMHSDGWWDAGYADWSTAEQYEDGGASFSSRVGKRNAGHVLDGQDHLNWPEVSHG